MWLRFKETILGNLEEPSLRAFVIKLLNWLKSQFINQYPQKVLYSKEGKLKIIWILITRDSSSLYLKTQKKKKKDFLMCGVKKIVF